MGCSSRQWCWLLKLSWVKNGDPVIDCAEGEAQEQAVNGQATWALAFGQIAVHQSHSRWWGV